MNNYCLTLKVFRRNRTVIVVNGNVINVINVLYIRSNIIDVTKLSKNNNIIYFNILSDIMFIKIVIKYCRPATLPQFY